MASTKHIYHVHQAYHVHNQIPMQVYVIMYVLPHLPYCIITTALMHQCMTMFKVCSYCS